jgi:hypothetical protein
VKAFRGAYRALTTSSVVPLGSSFYSINLSLVFWENLYCFFLCLKILWILSIALDFNGFHIRLYFISNLGC